MGQPGQTPAVDPARVSALVAQTGLNARTRVPNALRVSSDGEFIEYATAMGYMPSPPLRDCLNDFAKLGDAPAEQILTFAQSWGVLQICEHGRAWGRHDDDLKQCGPLYAPDRQPRGGGFWLREPLAWWRARAQQVRGLLGSAIALLALPATEWGETEQEWAWIISVQVQKWINDADIRPTFSWGPYPRAGIQTPRITPALFLAPWQAPPGADLVRNHSDLVWERSEARPGGFQYPTLFAVLGLQLAVALATQGELQRCGWCLQPFIVGHDVDAGPGRPRRYCSDACAHEARKRVQRESVRRHRAKRAGAAAEAIDNSC
jgi:hypothetical protein